MDHLNQFNCMNQAIKMHVMDDHTIEKRNLVVQEVINLTTVNGEQYLEKLRKFNEKFKPNQKVRLALYH